MRLAGDGNPVLDPALVAGKIVVCDRGATARVNKSLAVAEAGGVGMILLNTAASSLNADFHYVPSVHLAHTDYVACTEMMKGESNKAFPDSRSTFQRWTGGRDRNARARADWLRDSVPVTCGLPAQP